MIALHKKDYFKKPTSGADELIISPTQRWVFFKKRGTPGDQPRGRGKAFYKRGTCV